MLLDTLIRFTGITSCTWAERPPLPSQGRTGELGTRPYQSLRFPSLAKVVIHGADPVLVRFLTSCEQLKSLAVNVRSAYLEDSIISPGAAPISATHSGPASGLLEPLFIYKACTSAPVHPPAPRSTPFRHSCLRILTLIGSFRSLEEESQASQKVLDLCADALHSEMVSTPSYLCCCVERAHSHQTQLDADLARLTRLA